MSLNSENEAKLSPSLVLTALLSSGITGVISVTYLILSILALVYRFKCDDSSETEVDNARFTWNLVYSVYIKDAECGSALTIEDLTQSFSVFILATLTLCFSVLSIIASILLTVGVKNKQLSHNLNVIVPVYVTCWVGSLAVDLTLAVFLGMDYGYLTDQLTQAPEYIYIIDTLRHGVIVLMSVVLKGYVTIVINMVLIGLLIAFFCQHHQISKQEQHSIHKVGSINAFDQPRREDNWAPPEPMSPYASSYNRGMSTQSNHMYMNDEQPRSLPRSDHLLSSSQSFNRSDSWQHQPPHHGSRPFSYMDEIRRTVPLKPVTSPAPSSSQEPQWRRNDPWQQGPPVPAPDYSPHSPRRLKSALKSGYM